MKIGTILFSLYFWCLGVQAQPLEPASSAARPKPANEASVDDTSEQEIAQTRPIKLSIDHLKKALGDTAASKAARASELAEADRCLHQTAAQQEQEYSFVLAMLAAANQLAGNRSKSLSLYQEFEQLHLSSLPPAQAPHMPAELVEMASLAPMAIGNSDIAAALAEEAIRRLKNNSAHNQLIMAKALAIIGFCQGEKTNRANSEQKLRAALSIYNSLGDRSYQSQNIRAKLVDMAVERNNFKEAEPLCHQLIETEKQNGLTSSDLITYITRLANVYSSWGRHAEAVTTFRYWQEKLADHPELYVLLLKKYSYFLRDSGNAQAAAAMLTESSELEQVNLARARSICAMQSYVQQLTRAQRLENARLAAKLELQLRSLGSQVNSPAVAADTSSDSTAIKSLPEASKAKLWQEEAKQQETKKENALQNIQTQLQQGGTPLAQQQLKQIMQEFQNTRSGG